jgi:hypothetical protein
MGSVPSFRANVAYSLYGILKGDTDSGCNKRTFINSFHTTQGLESFTNAMAGAGLTDLFEIYDGEDHDDSVNVVTSTCNQDDEESADGDDGMYNGQKYYQSTSYGLGCSADGERHFAIHTYSGAYCDANAIVSTTDELEELNEKLSLSKCIPIYAGGYYSMDDDEMDYPLDVLATSRACRIHDGSGSCPDPYGLLKKREAALNKATAARYSGPYWTVHRVMMTAWSMIAAGIFLTLSAIVWVVLDRFKTRTKRSGWKKKKRKSSRKSKRNLAEDGVLEAPSKPNRERSDLSEALASVASQISQTFVDLTAAVRRRSSKKSKNSKSSKRSKRSKESNQQRRSNRTLEVPPDDDVTPVNMCVSPSCVSHDSATSNLSGEELFHVIKTVDPDGHVVGVDEAAGDYHSSTTETAAAGDYHASTTETAVALMDASKKDEESVSTRDLQRTDDALVNFWSEKRKELFHDEQHDDESVEIKVKVIPDELPQSSRPKSRRSIAEAEVESDWTEREEAASKKKWRKRRWFRNMVGY